MTYCVILTAFRTTTTNVQGGNYPHSNLKKKKKQGQGKVNEERSISCQI